jgi:hypothetical protein
MMEASMKTSILAATLALALPAGVALAGDDCRTPMADWQPREAAEAKAVAYGWTVERLKVDDGCYEIRGRDAKGNPVEAKLEPGTLAPVEIEVKFAPGADFSAYVAQR